MLGKTLGHYLVESKLGAGGMGVVYLCTDTRLGRKVAVKLLHDSFIQDTDRLARFEREARVLASLNHTHIAAIHGLEEADGTTFLALEYVPGDTLAERLRRGPLALKEALDICRQVADGLDAAHEKGIVHRDLKPANIKITPEGQVKILDFGLAKAVTQEGATSDLSQMATVTAEGTRAGMVLGTAAYMSPEQARARPVDRRTDIWAFGCVLYEMLTGRAAFRGETVTDILVAVLDQQPHWTALPPATPTTVRRLLQRCLEKDVKLRLRDIADARIELEQAGAAGADGSAFEPAGHGRGRTLATAAAVAIGVLSLTSAGLLWAWQSNSSARAAPADHRVSRFSIDLPPDEIFFSSFNPDLALSPDGTQVAYASAPGGVHIRRLDGLEQRLLESAAGYSTSPLFSPDGSAVSFIPGNAIISSVRPFLKAALSGGAPVKLAEYDMFHRGDWGADGWIYWTAQYPGGIVRIPDTGGDIQPVTDLDVAKGERSHRFANLLPGGEALIYTVGFEGIDSYDDARIDLWDLKSRQRKTLITGGTSAVYSASGHIVYGRGGKLFAVPFDLTRREVTGPPFEVLDGVMMSHNTGMAQFSLSKRGDLAYVPGPAEGGHRTLVWVDRAGKAEPLPLPPASYLYPRIAPDGRTLAIEIEGPNHDLFEYDFARGVLSKVTTDGLSHDPVWTPDGKRLVFRSWQSGGMTLWSMPSDRSASASRLDPTGTRQSPVSVSPDGKFLTFDQKDPQTEDDVWVLPLEEGGRSRSLIQSRFGEGSAKFSPDGRWVAYSSNESGRAEVYVQPFPGPGPKVQISNEGGIDPVWRPSGGELYYRRGNRMMVASVTTSPALRASAPTQLWEGNYSAGSASSCGMPGVSSSNYGVTADGQRFLMVRDDDAALRGTKIIVVLNWVEELKAKAGARPGPGDQ